MKSNLLAALFGGTKKEKDIKRLQPLVDKVLELDSWAANLTHEEMLAYSEKWSNQLVNNEIKLDDILFQAFAVAREASYRVLGEKHYPVQIMGALALHQGNILEMKTGEGKTLTCVLATYLNALTKKGVHVITVNDYLAKRDAAWMGGIYEYLGLTVGVSYSDQSNEDKKEAYKKDITYATNNEIGFDYLRDNLVLDYNDKKQKQHYYAIIDEIDSILIDEARTPLIISGQADDDSEIVNFTNGLVSLFKECEKDPLTNDYYEVSKMEMIGNMNIDDRGDFKLDEKSKKTSLTKQGITKLENILRKYGKLQGSEEEASIYSDGNFEYIHYITQAISAHKLYEKDVDYIVNESMVEIVDHFTGRVLKGRRYSSGLHQAIEAKERVKVLAQSKTYATITYQNLFRMYDKLAGMTGTAETEKVEFKQIYDVDVVVIPPNKPLARKDLSDLLFLNEEFKFNAILNDVKEIHKTGQPILVGTASIEKSEVLSALFRKNGLKHEVLNAKNHEKEAYIIGNAGKKGAITIATNMAGRGTDIKLGGSIEQLVYSKIPTTATKEEFQKAYEDLKDQIEKDNTEVKALGGLYIIGSERHESRRIDNQLRGRSGRQGDPGTSRFYVSLADNLMRLFASDNVKNIVGSLGLKDGSSIENKYLSNAIEKAQVRVEERNFEIRKKLLDFDDVLTKERQYIYLQRDEIIQDKNLTLRIIENSSDIALDLISSSKTYNQAIEGLKETFTTDFALSEEVYTSGAEDYIKTEINNIINEKIALVGIDNFNRFAKSVYLRTLDKHWTDHLDILEDIKDAAYLRTYAQKNPLVEYKNEASDAYYEMLNNVSTIVCKTIIAVRIIVNKGDTPKVLHNGPREKKQSFEKVATIRKSSAKVGRNDPCPCGSGKKYKQCCGK